MAARGTVLITGATSGIGLELLHVFLKNNFYVIAVGRDTKKLKHIAQLRNVVKAISAEITKEKSIDALLRGLEKDSLDVDILVNNAGAGVYGHFRATDLAKEKSVIDLNVLAVVTLTKKLLPGLIERRGKILNVASTAAFMPGPGMAVYFATKAFILSFSHAIHQELRGAVHVATLCPGPTQTQFGRRAQTLHSRLFLGKRMSASRVARIAYRGFMTNRRLITPGLRNKLMVLASKFAPASVVLPATAYILEEK